MKMIRRLFLMCGLAASLTAFAPLSVVYPQTIVDSLWGVVGSVKAIATRGNTIYIGGEFTYVGPATGSLAAIHASTGAADVSFARFNGEVYVIAPDGRGGWYVGGYFTAVGGVARNNIAHIEPDKTLDATWNPNADAEVYTLAVSGPTVYAGGEFTNIGGSVRNGIAALDTLAGSATSWDPNADAAVVALALSGSTLYVGGTFDVIGDSSRHQLAALDRSTGKATNWNPDNLSEACVQALAVSPNSAGGTTVYAGGWFTTTGDSVRNNLMALDGSTGSVLRWNPDPNDGINTLAVSGSTVYAGGWFSSLADGETTRNCIAAIDTGTGLATSWDPNADGSVNVLALSGSRMYAGGYFGNIGGAPRHSIAALDTSTGTATSWDPNPDGTVNTLVVSDSTVFTGGYFTSVGGVARYNIAALDATTGKATSWNPRAIGVGVYALALSPDGAGGSTVYAGGNFDSIGGAARKNIGALDASTGLATDWNPGAEGGGVRALAVSPNGAGGSTVYVGGAFSTIGGATRNCIAALDASTGNATSWNPAATNWVFALAVRGSTVYAAGAFTGYNSIGDSARNYIAALDTATGNATSWNPNADRYVAVLALSGSTVYAGGGFANIGGLARNHIAAIDTTSPGNATSWNPTADGAVQALALSGSALYAGGSFENIGGQPRKNIAAIGTLDTGRATSWNPTAGGSVSALALDFTNARVYVGGDFTTVFNEMCINFVGLTNPSDPALPVQLVAIRAKASGSSVQLVWHTATEVSNYGFEIQRKSDLNPEWAKVGFVPGAGSSNKTHSYTFTDRNVPEGRYAYRLKQIDRDGSFKFSQSTEVAVGSIPLEFSLAQNYPNPFNPSTTIRYGLPLTAKVKLTIHDLLGREIRTLVDEEQAAGWKEVRWDANGISSGVYFYTLRAGNFVQTKKLVMMK